MICPGGVAALAIDSQLSMEMKVNLERGQSGGGIYQNRASE